VNPEGAQGAAEALEVLGPVAAPALPALLDVLGRQVYDDPQASQVQAAAATAVAGIGVTSPEVVETLLERTEDRQSYATEPVLLALGRLAPAETSLPVLIAALERGPTSTQAAGRALAEMGAAATPAREALKRAIGAGPEEEGWLAWLGRLLPLSKAPRDLPESSGPAAALLVVGGKDLGLGHLDYQLRELPDYERRVVVASLWHARSAGFETLLPLMQRALKDPSEVVRRDTLLMLQRFGPEAVSVYPALVESFEDPDEHARVAALQAAWVVTEGDPERLLPHLIECLKDPGYRVRANAAQLIGRMGRAAASAAPALEQMADDPESWPRRSAARALRRVR
jgi:HEAT repeat protein